MKEPIKIDYVFPWVNPVDPLWRESFKMESGNGISDDNPRFRDFGLLKYLFRGIDKHMPWIGKVILIVSSESQLPAWLNRENVTIVYHKDFIPKEYLPTFNSNTIEMFLHRIPNLSKYFIYGNDDIYTIKDTGPEDFFTKSWKPVISYTRLSDTSNMFNLNCKRCYNLVKNKLGSNRFIGTDFIMQEHTNISLVKDDVKKVQELCSQEILESITKFRDFSKNLSQYIYADYEILTGNYVRSVSGSIGQSKSLINPSCSEIDSFMFNNNCKTICLNDGGISNLSMIEHIKQNFEKIFPEKCKYEI